MREDLLHVYIRKYLRGDGWKLLAGQFPNGTDDELQILTIRNPTSSAPRKHHVDAYVPDLVAFRNGQVLIIEIKPKYSQSDKKKLVSLVGEDLELLSSALQGHPPIRKLSERDSILNSKILPALCFAVPKKEVRVIEGFVHFEISESGVVAVRMGKGVKL